MPNRRHWLLLAHQLPTRPSKLRVKTWRRLQLIGAVPTRNSVYVLPNNAQCREDFEWIRGEVVALGGEATVFVAEALDASDDDLVALFRRARDGDYQAWKREVRQLRRPPRGRRRAAGNRDDWVRAVRRLRERLNEIERIDFFHAPAGRDASRTMTELENLVAGPVTPAVAEAPMLNWTAFRNRRWVTRPRPGVDRMASAWLIRRFIDPKATFRFAEQPRDSDVPFDMYAGEFSHHGPACTFETLARRFNLVDPAVVRIAQIVHDLDMKERRYAPPEAPAVSRIIDGLQELHADDHTLLEHGMAMFEALARSFSATESAPGRGERGRRAKRPRRANTKKG